MFDTIDEIQSAMEAAQYITDRPTATVMYLSLKLEKPILVEGEAGVGKTEMAKVLSQVLGTRLIRLQCYEGLDVNTALYEWNYPKQILYMKQVEICQGASSGMGKEIFGPEFLIRRPLLEAIQDEAEQPPVLLIDEIDRSDEEFEAFLLEVLSDFQITIPEIGTIQAKKRPRVILTSNRTRELHDALKRRCLYHWIDYPSLEKERRIVQAKVPGIGEVLLQQVCLFMQRVREKEFYKRPGIAETLDWALALIALGKEELDPMVVRETLGCIFKYREDMRQMEEAGLDQLLNRLPSRDDLMRPQIPCA
ncbi:MAG: MoxR family ATPase [Deltaproteobacteria bacterium]|nr:MoxR family ATPase [Deltaproteobacteria bacterium]